MKDSQLGDSILDGLSGSKRKNLLIKNTAESESKDLLKQSVSYTHLLCLQGYNTLPLTTAMLSQPRQMMYDKSWKSLAEMIWAK